MAGLGAWPEYKRPSVRGEASFPISPFGYAHLAGGYLFKAAAQDHLSELGGGLAVSVKFRPSWDRSKSGDSSLTPPIRLAQMRPVLGVGRVSQ